MVRRDSAGHKSGSRQSLQVVAGKELMTETMEAENGVGRRGAEVGYACRVAWTGSQSCRPIGFLDSVS